MGIFDKIKEGLSRTRAQLNTQIEWIVKGRSVDEEAIDQMQEAMLLADTGFDTADLLVESLKGRWKMGDIKTEEDIKRCMAEEVEKILRPCEAPLATAGRKPFVILTLGVNGVGKTTTIAKLARLFLDTGKTVLLGACDTFRAAAVEQLEVWAQRLNVEVIRQREGSDPAAVAFDAAKAAKARGSDILILDTAGRLHTKTNLMEEMKKIKRVVAKEIESGPHETLLIVDATNGQNVIAQAKSFHDALTITGLIITKLDGTAKGGFVLPIARTLQLPIRFIGVGEKMDDLVPFSARDFARALVE